MKRNFPVLWILKNKVTDKIFKLHYSPAALGIKPPFNIKRYIENNNYDIYSIEMQRYPDLHNHIIKTCNETNWTIGYLFQINLALILGIIELNYNEIVIPLLPEDDGIVNPLKNKYKKLLPPSFFEQNNAAPCLYHPKNKNISLIFHEDILKNYE